MNVTEEYENLFSDVDFLEAVYIDDGKNSEFEDDGFIHVIRNGKRFVFYKGQGKGMLGKKDVSKYAKIVDKKLK